MKFLVSAIFVFICTSNPVFAQPENIPQPPAMSFSLAYRTDCNETAQSCFSSCEQLAEQCSGGLSEAQQQNCFRRVDKCRARCGQAQARCD